MSDRGFEPAQGPIRVLIVDDHPVLREGMTAVLAGDADVVVVGSVGTIAEALIAVERREPDVVFLDHQLPDGEGIAALPRFLELRPALNVVIATRFATPDLARHALAAGARGFLTKDSETERLVEAVHAVVAGRLFVDERLQHSDNGFSARELRVLELVAEGDANADIAKRLGVSSHSVRTYLRRARGKLGAKNRTEAAGIAVAMGLVRRRTPINTAFRPEK